jgi:DNA invertase Pin-like site-specific DNA recombinase
METAARQAISYHRFSTTGQAKGDSDRRYRKMAVDVCKAKEWILNETLTFHDAGKSGFHGVNLAQGGDLARFLSLIERTVTTADGEKTFIPGPVKAGNVLILESLDRLSRLNPWDAFQIIQQIVNAGVWIYTGFGRRTFNLETVRDGTVSLSYIDSVLTVAYEESLKKSERATAAWEAAHEKARNEGKAHSKNLPPWVRINAKGEMEAWPERFEIMREICRLYGKMGAHAIIKSFNANGVKTWQRNGRWSVPSITKWMHDRALIGEYQPQVGRKDHGEVIQNYYPPVLPDAEFYAMHAAAGTRKKVVRGRRGKTVANLFGALCVSGDDGSTMRVSYHSNHNRYFVSVDAITGKSPFVSFSYNVFESAFLRHVAELDLSETTSPDLAEIAALEGERAAVRARMDQIHAAAADIQLQKATFDNYMKMIPKLTEQDQSLTVRIDTAKAKAHRPMVTTSDVAKLAAELGKLPANEQAIGREKIKNAIQAVVDKIEVYVRRDGKKRNSPAVCLALVTLRDEFSRIIEIRTQGKMWTSRGLGIKFKSAELDAAAMSDQLLTSNDLSGAFLNNQKAKQFDFIMA